MSQCRRVVHAIAGHRNGVAAPLELSNKGELLFWAYARVDADARRVAWKSAVPDVFPGYDGCTLLDEANLLSDGGGRARVISRHHHDSDARRRGVGNGLGSLGSRGIS